jgi:hypothetical protein
MNKQRIDAATPSELARSIAAGAEKASMKAQRKSKDSIAVGACLCQSCSPFGSGDLDESSQTTSNAPSPKDAHLAELTSAIQASIAMRLPATSVSIEKVTTEESTKGTVFAEVPIGSLSISQCYDAMQQARQTLADAASRSDALILLSARVQKEDSGYSLRSSVACVPSNVHDKVCWEIVRHGSCPRNKCCKWWHPQAVDLIKLKIVIRRRDSKCLKK